MSRKKAREAAEQNAAADRAAREAAEQNAATALAAQEEAEQNATTAMAAREVAEQNAATSDRSRRGSKLALLRGAWWALAQKRASPFFLEFFARNIII